MTADRGLFYEYIKMATDVDVQFFSHLNGLTLGNNWGDLIRLFDACLVNGLPLTSITSATIDAQGDIHLTTYAAHNSTLFQIVELSGFVPSELNGKYRIKGAPSPNQLILKAVHVGKTVNTAGTAKLASLGYEIIFRDMNDVKRVYRAKNPRSEHPFIRVDETISDGVSSYNSNYAKYAMVGMLEHMNHIDDYENPDVLQLPFDPVNPVKNWNIAGNGTNVVRGWSKWYWSTSRSISGSPVVDSTASPAGTKEYVLVGDSDAFFLVNAKDFNARDRLCHGCGLFNSSQKNDIIPNWFLATVLDDAVVSTAYNFQDKYGCTPFSSNTISPANVSKFFLTPGFNEVNKLTNHVFTNPIVPDYYTGRTGIYPVGDVSALEVPFSAESMLRGCLKHIHYSGKVITAGVPSISETSMYLSTPVGARETSGEYGGYYFYLGELE
jgi:hypothetical protein